MCLDLLFNKQITFLLMVVKRLFNETNDCNLFIIAHLSSVTPARELAKIMHRFHLATRRSPRAVKVDACSLPIPESRTKEWHQNNLPHSRHVMTFRRCDREERKFSFAFREIVCRDFGDSKLKVKTEENNKNKKNFLKGSSNFETSNTWENGY